MSEFKKALDALEQSTGYYWTAPLQWDHRQGKLAYIPPSRKLLPWLMVLLLCGNQIMASWVVLGLQLFGLVNLPMLNILIVFGIGGLEGFAFLVEMAKVLAGKLIAFVFGELLNLEKQWKEG